MNSKKIFSILAVAVMLFAGSACVLAGSMSDASTSEVQTSNINGSITIDSTGKITSNPSEFKASYNESKHTLSFNEDVSVSTTDNYFIYSYYPGLTIEINSNVVLSSESPKNDFFTGLLLFKTEIRGTGSLTLNLSSVASVIGIGCFGDLTIKGVDVTINSPATAATSYRGMMDTSVINIIGSSVTIDNSKHTSGTDYVGIYVNTCVLNVVDSDLNLILANDIGITGEEKSAISVKESSVHIESNEKSTIKTFGIKSKGDVTFTKSVTTADFSKGKDQSCISCKNFVSDKSEMMLDFMEGKDAISADDMKLYHSVVLIGGTNIALLSNNSLDIRSCFVGININGQFAIAMTAADSTLNIKDSTVFAVNTFGGGFFAKNYAIEQSDVNVKSDKEAFADMGTSKFSSMLCDNIYGSDGTVEPTTKITDPVASKSKWVHVVTAQTMSFDLGEGVGTPIASVKCDVGKSMILPECDAKSGDREFIGWTDGFRMYEAGDEYTVVINTTFVAMYAEPIVGPTISDLTPSPKDKVTSPEFIVSGTVMVSPPSDDAQPVTVTVSLNGGNAKTVTVDQTGKFSTKVDLANGQNTIIVKAVGADGGVTAKVISVTYDDGSSSGDKGIDTNVALFVILCVVIAFALILMVVRNGS